MTFLIESNAFKNNGFIPIIHTIYGTNISPLIEWKDAPCDTKCFVLIMEDCNSWCYWIIYNIPNHINKLREGIKTLPTPAIFGINSWEEQNYCGPCIPKGIQKYFFKLFALNTQIKKKDKVNSFNIERLIKPYIIDETVLVGLYEEKII
ncbi:MAG: YbhB/YbcL family Raf kinase inhibitor-like protein [Flavobacteriales bacterium]|nr:YbhB/YbcL family Raf kinase inhibitor-like protein [Flavobacteriales bacterium]